MKSLKISRGWKLVLLLVENHLIPKPVHLAGVVNIWAQTVPSGVSAVARC